MAYATVVKKSVFDSAHRNTGFGEGHKCNNIHGHTFQYEVAVRAKVDKKTGLSIDFGIIKDAMKENVDKVLDHKFLNEDVEYFKNTPPSAENIALFIISQVQLYLNMNYNSTNLNRAVVEWVKLHETPTSTVIITRADL